MEIIDKKFFCKNTKSGYTDFPNGKFDIFTEGKWYDGEYEVWNYERGYEINGGWRKYWVINEKVEK